MKLIVSEEEKGCSSKPYGTGGIRILEEELDKGVTTVQWQKVYLQQSDPHPSQPLDGYLLPTGGKLEVLKQLRQEVTGLKDG